MTAGAARLRTVFFHLTKACNLRCRYCYFSAATPLPDELDAAELAALWPQVIEAAPEKLVLTGGEPLLRRDLLSTLRALADANHRRAVRVCLNTNGHLLTVAMADALATLVDEVRVSVDGFEEENDQQRGRGNYQAAMAAIGTLQAARVPIKAMVTVTPQTLEHLGAWLAVLLRRGITAINVNPARPVGRTLLHAELVTTREAVTAAIDRAWRGAGRAGAPTVTATEEDGAGGSQTTCGVGSFVNVMPNGDVFPCHVLTAPEHRCGNLRTHRLSDLFGPSGPLAVLRALHFAELAEGLPEAAALTRPGSCLGELAASAPSLRRRLPVLGA